MEINKLSDSNIYFFSSLVLILINYLFDDYFTQERAIIFLIASVVFLGLPHGALDTLLAKQNSIYKNTLGFIYFNITYLLLAIIFFVFWIKFSSFALFIFLLISIFHFSEDWQMQLSLTHRLALATFIVSNLIFFQSDDVKSIFYILTKSNLVDNIISFYRFTNYFMIPAVLIIFFLNLKNKYLLLNIITIFFTALILDPLLYFLSYFCFFHSIRNYRESIKILNLEKYTKKYKILAINVLITILISFLLYKLYLLGSVKEKIIQITFIGLAALTVPHMILKIYIKKKNK